MKASILRSGVAALALGGILTAASALPLPARADTTTTRNIIYGAAAAAAAFTLYNVEHKHQLATSVQGYLPDGSTVYKDGHVVSRNGQTWYPGNYGETVACSNQYCSINGGNGYNNGYGRYGYNNNNRYGYNNNRYGYNNNRYGYNNNRYGYNNNAPTYSNDRSRLRYRSSDRDRDGGRGH